MQYRHNGIVYRPAQDTQLEAQIMSFIIELRIEYGVSATKVHFYQIRQGEFFEERKLKLPSKWRDTAVLADARRGFDRLVERNTRR